MLNGTLNSLWSISPTSGIRELPPTSTMAVSSLGATPADAQGPPDRGNRLEQRRSHHRLELGPGEPDRGVQPRQGHRDSDVGLRRQRLLGLHAVAPQPGQPDRHRRVVEVERRQPPPSARRTSWSTASSRSVAAEVLDPVRAPSTVKPSPVSPARRRRRCPRRGRRRRSGHPRRPWSAPRTYGRGLGLGAVGGRQVGQRARPGPAAPACTDPSWPGGSDDQLGRGLALLRRGACHHPAQQAGHQSSRRVGRTGRPAAAPDRRIAA